MRKFESTKGCVGPALADGIMRQEPIDYESRQKADGGNCPFCRSTSVVTGKLVGGEGRTGFVADHLKSFVWTFTPFHVVVRAPRSSAPNAAQSGRRRMRPSSGNATLAGAKTVDAKSKPTYCRVPRVGVLADLRLSRYRR